MKTVSLFLGGIFLFAVLAIPSVSFAKESAGVMPGEFFYFLDRFTEKVSLAITKNPARKAEKALQYAEERFAELENVVNTKGANTEKVEQALDEYKNGLKLASNISVTIEEKGQKKDIFIKISDSIASIKKEIEGQPTTTLAIRKEATEKILTVIKEEGDIVETNLKNVSEEDERSKKLIKEFYEKRAELEKIRLGIGTSTKQNSKSKDDIFKQKTEYLKIFTSPANDKKAEIKKEKITQKLPIIIPAITVSTTTEKVKETISPISAKPKVYLPISPNHIYLLEDDGSFDFYEDLPTSIDTNAVTKAFFEKYPDVYDFMAIFPAFPPKKEFDTIANTFDIRNDIRGICREISSCLFFETCYSNKLKSLSLFTARNNNYNELVNTPETLVNVVLHEMAHHWGVSLGNYSTVNNLTAKDKLPDGVNKSCTLSDIPLAKTNTNHWSRGLVMPYPAIYVMEESFPWVDRGGGIYTYDLTLFNQPRRYHPFDLYLMGFLNPSQITYEFTLLTDTEDYCCDLPDGNKMGGNDFGIKAKASKVTIKDVIRIAGEERKPSASSSQKDFKIALVILVKKGQKPSENMMKTIESVSKILPERWSYATQNLATLNK